MNGDNIVELNKIKLNFDLVVYSYVTSPYIAGTASKKK